MTTNALTGSVKKDCGCVDGQHVEIRRYYDWVVRFDYLSWEVFRYKGNDD